MAYSIAGITCNALNGAIQPTVPSVTRWSQFGEDGCGAFVGNKRQQRVELVSTHKASGQTAGDGIVASAKAVVGTVAAIIYGSQTINNALVESVLVEKSTAVSGMSGGSWVVQLRWSVMVPVSI